MFEISIVFINMDSNFGESQTPLQRNGMAAIPKKKKERGWYEKWSHQAITQCGKSWEEKNKKKEPNVVKFCPFNLQSESQLYWTLVCNHDGMWIAANNRNWLFMHVCLALWSFK